MRIISDLTKVCAVLFVFALAAAPALGADRVVPSDKEGLEALYKEFKKLELDSANTVAVQNFNLSKDVMKVNLRSGHLYFTKTVNDAVTGAIFVGDGEFSIVPPTDIEKDELERYTKERSLKRSFEQAYFRFSGKYHDRFSGLGTGTAPEFDRAQKIFKEREAGLGDLNVDPAFFTLFGYLNSDVYFDEFFVGEFLTEDLSWVSFVYDPLQPEEIILAKHKKIGLYGNQQSGDIWCQFHRAVDYEADKAGTKPLYEDDKDIIDITDYNMDLTITKKEMVIDTKVDVLFKSLANGVRFIPFVLLDEFFVNEEKLHVTSITGPDGKDLPWIHEGFNLGVLLTADLKTGDAGKIRFEYNGRGVEPIGPITTSPDMPALPPQMDFIPSSPQAYMLLNTYPWYPWYAYLKRVNIDWTVRVPKPLIAAASGTTVREWEEGDYNCFQSIEKEQIHLPCVIFGRYEKMTDKSIDGETTINVYALVKQRKAMQTLMNETKNIIQYYENILVPYPYKEMDIVQMNFGMGFAQAPPGLIQLTGECYLSQSELAAANMPPVIGGTKFLDYFLPHEIAHQWWAHSVGWKTDHDVWISESFAEYTSGLYVQAVRGNDTFSDKLSAWKKSIDSIPDKDRGPLSIVARLDSYINTIYRQGPYTLHMLRMLMGDEKFLAALKTFQETHYNDDAATEEFEWQVSKTFGYDMRWFFDQWYRGTGIPTLNFEYEINPTEDGHYVVVGTINQENTDDFKKMVIPVYVHLKDGSAVKLQYFVDKNNYRFQHKVQAKPEKVVLDEFKTTLATVITQES